MDSKNPKPETGFAAAEPNAVLGLWTSWMQTASESAQAWSKNPGEPGKLWNQDAAAGDLLASGVRQLNELLGNDPALRALDQMWNANPLRDVVPVDWAEIAKALRTVWLRSLRDPAKAVQ